MQNIKRLVVLLAAMLIVPISVIATPSDITAESSADTVKHAQRALLLAEAQDARDQNEDDRAEGEYDDTQFDDEEGGSTHVYKGKGADKKELKDAARQARDAARGERHIDRDEARQARDGVRGERHLDRNEIRGARDEARGERKRDGMDKRGERHEQRSKEMDNIGQRMQDAETDEERRAIAEEMRETRNARRESRDQERNVIRDERSEVRDQKRDAMQDERRQQHSQSMDEYATRMEKTETAEQRAAITKEMKALRDERSEQRDERHGDRRGVSLDRQDELKAVRGERSVQPEEIEARHTERSEAAETAKQKPVMQEGMKIDQAAETQAERVEDRKEEKPWWKFWGD